MRRISVSILVLILAGVITAAQVSRRSVADRFGDARRPPNSEPRPLPPSNLRKGISGAAPTSPADKDLIQVDPADMSRYKSFLASPDTGLAKLLFAAGVLNAHVVTAVPGGTLPGHGGCYSFRTRDHSFHEVSDLRVINGAFQAGSNFTQGLIVDLGKVELEGLSLNSEGVAKLAKFIPAKTPEEATRQTSDIQAGIKDGPFLARAVVPAAEGSTYVLRSIAYRVGGEVDRDRRRDVVIVFSVVRSANDGLTILWKSLSDTEAPRLRLHQP